MMYLVQTVNARAFDSILIIKIYHKRNENSIFSLLTVLLLVII